MGLTLTGVSKSYGATQVLQPLSLTIPSGEFLTLLGPSGSGKTTVLRLIGGFALPSSGRIDFDGIDVTRQPPNRRPFNTVFQDYALFPHMTVAGNVGYGPLVQRLPAEQSRKKVAETLEIVGLGDLRDRYPSQLSGGQRQRVALARAIVCEPKVILLDEPLAALDAALRRQMQQFLKSIQRRIRTTFVFVTHDQDEAIAISDRIVVMQRGQIEQDGTPQELYRRPRTRFVAGFFGDNNLIEGTLCADRRGVETAMGRLPCLPGASTCEGGSRVLLAVRPESIRIARADGCIAGTVMDVLFGGATTTVRLQPDRAAGMLIDLHAHGTGGSTLPNPGEKLSVTYDPADAAVVPA